MDEHSPQNPCKRGKSCHHHMALPLVCLKMFSLFFVCTPSSVPVFMIWQWDCPVCVLSMAFPWMFRAFYKMDNHHYQTSAVYILYCCCFQRATLDQHRHCRHWLLGQPARRNIWQGLLAFSWQTCELLFVTLKMYSFFLMFWWPIAFCIVFRSWIGT